MSVDGWYRVCSCMYGLGNIHTYYVSLLISQHYCSPMYSLLIMQHCWLHTVRACYITYTSHTAVSSDLYAVDEGLDMCPKRHAISCYWLIHSATYMLIKIYSPVAPYVAISLYNIIMYICSCMCGLGYIHTYFLSAICRSWQPFPVGHKWCL